MAPSTGFPSITRTVRLAIAAITIGLLAACGGGGSDSGGATPPPPPAGIGPAGGTVTGPNGAQVVVPAGALANSTAIAVAEAPSGFPALPTGMTAAGSVYAFTPHGTAFAQPASITVPFNPASVPAGATPMLMKTANGAAGPWEPVAGATVSGSTMRGNVSSFSFGVVTWSVVATAPQITTQPADQTVDPGQAANFTVVASGTAPLTYQWQRSTDNGATFADVAGAITASFFTPVTVLTDTGTRYRVVVSNSAGSVTSAAATLTVRVRLEMPRRIDVSEFDVLALLANGTVMSWSPATGQPPAPVSGVSNAIAVSTGTRYGLALLADGTVRAWGISDYGQLGDGQVVATARPPVVVSGLANVSQISAGRRHALAMRGGFVYAWGDNSSGQLGFGFVPNNPNTHQSATPVQVLGVSNVVAVSAQDGFSLALRNDGTVFEWGISGVPTPLPVLGMPTVIRALGGGRPSIAWNAGGQIWYWNNSDGIPSAGIPNSTIGSTVRTNPALPAAFTAAAGVQYTPGTTFRPWLVIIGATNNVTAYGAATEAFRNAGPQVEIAGSDDFTGLQAVVAAPDGSVRVWAPRIDNTQLLVMPGVNVN